MILDDTRPVQRSRYRDVIERYAQKLSACPEIRAVYGFGQMDAPGLSDIDILVICRGRVFPTAFAHNRLVQDNDERYLFFHAPTILPAALFEQLAYWYPAGGTELVWGRGIPRSDGAAAGDRLLQIVTVLHLLLYKAVGFIPAQLAHDHISAKHAIALINSLRHSYEGTVRVGGEPRAEVAAFFESFSAFRAEWFERDSVSRREELTAYIEGLPRTIAALIASVDQLLTEAPPDDGIAALQRECVVRTGTARFDFRRNWNPDDFERQFFEAPRRHVLPQSLATGLRIGASLQTGFSRHLRRVGVRSARGNAHVFGPGVRRHFQLLDSFAKFRALNFRDYGAREFLFGYRPLAHSLAARLPERARVRLGGWVR